jgi:hypothetical protein
MSNVNSKRIQALNDQFRKTFQGGKVVMTRGIQALGDGAVADILNQVRVFSNFNKDNDLYGEHDFGSFTAHGEKVFFKLDYYDAACEFGSSNPADPAVTTRVLTIMLASEY